MKLDFDLDNITLTEFGVGRGSSRNPILFDVRVNSEVKSTLYDLAQKTWEAMQSDTDRPKRFDPSELYPNTKYVYVGLSDYEVAFLKELHCAKFIPTISSILKDAHKSFCYFTRLKDNQGRYLTALRRTSQFRGSLSEKNIVLRQISDTLAIEKGNLFKLENDFDLLIDSKHIHIWKPQGFVTLGNLNQEILNAVPLNISEIQQKIPYVDLESIQEYVSTHLRAAKYLKSVCSQQLEGIDCEELAKACSNADVKIIHVNGKLLVADGHEIGFLEILDRRRFSVSLIREAPEKYRATGRSILNK